jgi:hypothetical protein
MIEPVDIRLHDVVYKVTQHNDYFNREKIKMVDANGIEWHRYDRPILRWTVTEYQLQGIVSIAVIGTVTDPEGYVDTYHFQDLKTGKIVEFDDDDNDVWEELYRTQAEADAVVEQYRAAHELEMQNE